MKKRTTGFTLIELVVGLSLFALLGVATARIFWSTTRSLVAEQTLSGLQSELKSVVSQIRKEASYASLKIFNSPSELRFQVKTMNGERQTGIKTSCVPKPANLAVTVEVPCRPCNSNTEIPVLEDLSGKRWFPSSGGTDLRLPFAGGACFSVENSEIHVTLTGWVRDPKNPTGLPLMAQVKTSFPEGGSSMLQPIKKF